jgi:hypothetical protein
MNNQPKHTPAPWRLEVIPNPKIFSNQLFIRPANTPLHREWIADVGLDDDHERVANARLIATAPELLLSVDEAWLTAMEILENDTTINDITRLKLERLYKQCNLISNKAKGGV